MIAPFKIAESILDTKVPDSFFENIEEPYEITFRDYVYWYINETEIWVQFGKKVNNNSYPDLTNEQAWIDYFHIAIE